MRWFRAPAKINLTLHVVGRRTDGYHDIESLVAFGGICDWLGYEPGAGLELEVCGPRALEAGAVGDNLVLRAARALGSRMPRLSLGRFRLVKRLPAAAGLGGGSSDAAAAFRALADANGLPIEDERLRAAALETGSDVPVCLSPRSANDVRHRRSSRPAGRLAENAIAVLVNPGIAAPDEAGLRARWALRGFAVGSPGPALRRRIRRPNAAAHFGCSRLGPKRSGGGALRVAPAIADALETLSRVPDAKLTRMSGSGATCFALFDNRRSAAAAR